METSTLRHPLESNDLLGASSEVEEEEDEDRGLDDSTEETDLKPLKPPKSASKKGPKMELVVPIVPVNIDGVQEVHNTVAEPLYEEDLIDGFSFAAFKSYEDLGRMAKWSESHNGKFPDPYAKLTLQEDKDKKEKKKKKKKKREREKQKQLEAANNGNKNSPGSTSERGYICDSESSDDEPLKKPKCTDNGSPGLFDNRRAPLPNGLNSSVALPTSPVRAPSASSCTVTSGSSTGTSTFSTAASTASSLVCSVSSGIPGGKVPGGAQPPAKKGLYRPYAISPPPPPPTGLKAPPISLAHPAYRPPSHNTLHDPFAFSAATGFPPSTNPFLNFSAGPPPLNGCGPPHSFGLTTTAANSLSHTSTVAANRPSPTDSTSRERRESISSVSSLSQGSLTPSTTPSGGKIPPAWPSPGHPLSGVGSSSLPSSSTGPPKTSSFGRPAPSGGHGSLSSTLAPDPRVAAAGGGSDILRRHLDPRFLGPLASSGLHPLSGRPGDMQRASVMGPTSLPPAAAATPTGPTSLLPNSMMKDVPKLGETNPMFYPGMPPLAPGASASSSSIRPPFVNPAVSQSPLQSPMTPKKSGKWNAMHVRIAWEIYNHQQKQKGGDGSKPGSSAHGSHHPSSLSSSGSSKGGAIDLLGKQPPPPGSADLLKAKGPLPPPEGATVPGLSNDLLRGYPPGLPRPPADPMSPFGMHHRPQYPPGLFGPSPMGAISPFPRFGNSTTPFGGLGSLRGAGGPLSDPFGLVRPPPFAPASTSASSSWPLKCESSLLSSHEKSRREAEERRFREDRDRRQRDKERKEASRKDAAASNSRTNGDIMIPDYHARRRDNSRSPIRSLSTSLSHASPGGRSTTSSSGGLAEAGAPSPLVKKEDGSHRPSSALDMTTNSNSSRPSSRTASADGHVAGLKSEMKREDPNEVTVVSEKEGNTTTAHNGARPGDRFAGSLKRGHSPHINHALSAKDRNHGNPPIRSGGMDPRMSRGLHPPPPPGAVSHSMLFPPGMTSPVSSADPRSLYANLIMATVASSMPNSHASPLLSLAGAGLSSMAGHGSMDPFRDPYRAMAMYGSQKVDPLREARERELLRMNPLGSMIMSEQDRARMASMGYPPPGASPGGLFGPHTSMAMLGAGGLVSHSSAAHAAAAAAAAKSPFGLYPPHHGFPMGPGSAAAAAAMGALGPPGGRLPSPMNPGMNGALGPPHSLHGKDFQPR